MSYIGSKPANKPVVASDLDPAVITGQTALAVAPADTDEFLISDGGTLKRLDASLVGGGGITEADMFRLSTTLSGDHDPIASNLERVDDATFSKIGTGMTESSGVFSFPSTGLYLITWQWSIQLDSSSDASMIGIIQGTSNNFTASDDLVYIKTSGDTGNNQNQSVDLMTYFNCTNISTHKIRFSATGMNSNNTKGNTDRTETGFSFIRLGDSQ